MQKSCLVGLVLVAALLLAASLALRRYVLQPTASPVRTPALAVTPPDADASGAQQAQPATPPASPSPPLRLAEDRVYEQRIEGLFLEAVQPLVLQQSSVRGITAAEGSLYITATDEDAQTVWLHQVDPTTGAILRSLPLHNPGLGAPCGLQAGHGLLWTCVTTGEGSVLLGIAPDAWSVAVQAPVTVTLSAVAQVDEHALLGVARDGRHLYRLGTDGTLYEAVPSALAIAYGDCEIIRGSLVCTGVEPAHAVLDVIDPLTLTLLARHRASTRTLWGAWVAGNALALDGERFLLVPAGGELPLLWTYRLDGGSLADFVPSTQAER